MDRFSVLTDERGPNCYVVVLTGELDMAYAGHLQSVLQDLITPGARVVLDVGGLTFMDSTGLSTLLHAAQVSKLIGATFLLAAPHPAVTRILNMTGTAHALDTRDDVLTALSE